MTDLSQLNGHAATDPRVLERDIARQRAQLADTVDALSERLNVKHRAETAARETTARLRDAATTEAGRPRPDLLAAGALVVAGIALLAWWQKHS
jgi:hypothetical protein